MRRNIIIVGDFNRDDFLKVAEILHDTYTIYFLEYSLKSEVVSEAYKRWGTALFWGDYDNALDLIERVKPKLVLFYFIESFNHVALNVACKYKGVKTYHIEHGIRNYEMLQANIDAITRTEQAQPSTPFTTRLKTLRNRLNGRLFFTNTTRKLPGSLAFFLKQYFKVRRSNSIFETFRQVNNPLRLADTYVSFSPKIFEFHQKSDHLPSGYPVHFIGCPAFDYLAHLEIRNPEPNCIMFIDNAFESQKLFGWNEGEKILFLEQLVQLARTQKMQLLIKPHPYSNPRVYAALKNQPHVRLINGQDDFLKAAANAKVVLGFYSTLLLPLMAMAHTVCFSLAMHPLPSATGIADFLIETGALEKIESWEQMHGALKNLTVIAQGQARHKEKFIADWLYKFDGRSTERLRSILIADEAA